VKILRFAVAAAVVLVAGSAAAAETLVRVNTFRPRDRCRSSSA